MGDEGCWGLMSTAELSGITEEGEVSQMSFKPADPSYIYDNMFS
jgi:hypothetical protein